MISCVITTYKREPEVLKKAVDSILSQSYKDIEIIVVNDAPEDSELSNRLYKMLSEYDFPINYIVHESNVKREIRELKILTVSTLLF